MGYKPFDVNNRVNPVPDVQDLAKNTEDLIKRDGQVIGMLSILLGTFRDLIVSIITNARMITRHEYKIRNLEDLTVSLKKELETSRAKQTEILDELTKVKSRKQDSTCKE